MNRPSSPWGVPDTWAWVPIGDVASVVGGGTPRTSDATNFDDGTVSWVTPADLSGYTEKYIRRGSRNITTAGLEKSGARLLPKGSVLFSSRAPIGYVAIASKPLATNQGFKSFVLPSALDPEYIYYFLKRAKGLALNLASGTTFQEISGRQAAKIPLAVAPTAEQHRIVEAIESYLTRLDDAVATLKRVQRNLKRYRASVLKAAVEGRLVPTEAELARAAGRSYEPASVLLERILSERRRRWEKAELAKMKAKGNAPKNDTWKDKYSEPATPDTTGLTELPEGWCWTTVGAVTECLDSLRVPVSKKERAINGGAVPYYGANGQTGWIDQALFNEPLVLVVEDETFTGRTEPFSYRIEGPSWVNNHAHVLRPIGPLTARFLNYSLMFYPFIPLTTGTTARRKLTQKALMSAPYPLSPVLEQERIVHAAEVHLSLWENANDAIDQTILRSARLRQSILRWAFEGRLVDQDPRDEPASVLLERIRAERGSTSGTPARRRSRGTKRQGRTAKVPAPAGSQP